MKNERLFPIFLMTLTILPLSVVSCSSAGSAPASYSSRLAYSNLSAGAVSDGWVDIFVYNDAAPFRLDTYVHLDALEENLDIGSSSGPKKMVAVANCNPDLLTYDRINSYENIRSALHSLVHERPDRPVMSGECEFVAAGGAYADIVLRPLLCRIKVNSLEIDLSDRPYGGRMMVPGRAYLINVNGICPIIPESSIPAREVINYGGLDSFATSRMECPQMLMSDSAGDARLYCYPCSAEQTGAPPGAEKFGQCTTKLVVETIMDGVTYYYPIETGDLKSGYEYSYDIRITRTGCLDPDSSCDRLSLEVNCQVLRWNERDETVEDF